MSHSSLCWQCGASLAQLGSCDYFSIRADVYKPTDVAEAQQAAVLHWRHYSAKNSGFHRL